MSIESRYYEALRVGDTLEAQRLYRLMQRLDEQRQAYGKAQRYSEEV